jgi:hypothetical protein
MLPVIVIAIAIAVVTVASRIERKLLGSHALEPLAKAHPQVWANALSWFMTWLTVALFSAGLLWVSLSPK